MSASELCIMHSRNNNNIVIKLSPQLKWSSLGTLREEVDELAKRLKLKLFRTSVKEDFNVNQGNDDSLYSGICIASSPSLSPYPA